MLLSTLMCLCAAIGAQAQSAAVKEQMATIRNIYSKAKAEAARLDKQKSPATKRTKVKKSGGAGMGDETIHYYFTASEQRPYLITRSFSLNGTAYYQEYLFNAEYEDAPLIFAFLKKSTGEGRYYFSPDGYDMGAIWKITKGKEDANAATSAVNQAATQKKALATILAQEEREQAGKGKKTIYVSNEVEFFKALGSDREIVIKPDHYFFLSPDLEDDESCADLGITWVGDAMDLAPSARGVYSEEVYDGRQLTLKGFRNLTIRGERNVEIVVRPRYAFVFNFVDCQNVKIENLTLGHTDEGNCMGGVVGMTRCKGVTINHSDLYGCGTYGIEANDCSNVRMERSIIRDCSYGIMVIHNCNGVQFNYCDFHNNKDGVSINDQSQNILFSNCRATQNNGYLLAGCGADIRMENCEIHHISQEMFTDGEMAELIDDLGGNSWTKDAPTLSKRDIGPK